MFKDLSLYLLSGLTLFAASPSSASYILKSYDYGTGGVDTSSSSSYRLDAVTGEQTGDPASSASFKLNSGEIPTQQAFVVAAPTISNPASYYNKLKIVVNSGTNPSDTKYLIAISPDSFTTTYYVQPDNSIGTALSISNYQTYAAWGGASGFLVTGLTSSTTYSVKVRPMQGRFTETSYSAIGSAATVAPTLSFGLTTTLSVIPPFVVGFSSLIPGVVTAANGDINISLATNASLGGEVYVVSSDAGLSSVASAYTLSSASADLAVASSGYGAQVTSTSQASGGPFSSVAPYNGSSDNVGALGTVFAPIATTSNPLTGGTAVVRLKAKSESITPSASDYADTPIFVAAMSY